MIARIISSFKHLLASIKISRHNYSKVNKKKPLFLQKYRYSEVPLSPLSTKLITYSVNQLSQRAQKGPGGPEQPSEHFCINEQRSVHTFYFCQHTSRSQSNFRPIRLHSTYQEEGHQRICGRVDSWVGIKLDSAAERKDNAGRIKENSALLQSGDICLENCIEGYVKQGPFLDTLEWKTFQLALSFKFQEAEAGGKIAHQKSEVKASSYNSWAQFRGVRSLDEQNGCHLWQHWTWAYLAHLITFFICHILQMVNHQPKMSSASSSSPISSVSSSFV